MNHLSSFLLVLCFSLLSVPHLIAQNNLLGEIDFPNSGIEDAQDDFYEGVLFLHNFEYGDAARAFRRAQEIDPDFAMAYWGEAMTHNHPIWMQQDREAAMEVLNRLGNSVEERQQATPTQREKEYLMAIEVLYGNTPESQGKTKEARDDLYSEYLARLHEEYPGDHEITTFYGLSILGTSHEGRDFSIYMQAAAELFDVWNANEKHPGAAHYLIHSFDDPVHAPLGLPMARAYSEIAPNAAHAQHMTSHIFLALGMWEGVIDANLVARDVQTGRQRELGEKTTVCGHYTWWLQYGYLQNGEPENAAEVLNGCYDRISGNPSTNEKWHFAVMRGHQVIDTENWDAAQTWSASLNTDSNAAVNHAFISAFAAFKKGNSTKASDHLDTLKETPDSEEKTIQIHQLEGLLQINSGNESQGLDLLQKAADAESELPVGFGPPTIVKPSLELLGDVFMEMGRYNDAMNAYSRQLEKTPDRRRSRLGMDEAKDQAASSY